MRALFRPRPLFAGLAAAIVIAGGAWLEDARAFSDRATRPSLDGVYAVKGARVVTVTGGVIENGVIVVRDGLIESVGGEGSAIPFDAEVIDATGLVAYPGFVDAGTDAGIDVELEKKRKENVPGGYADAARDVIPEMPPENRRGIHADVDVTEILKVEAATFSALREAGFVAGEVAPKRGAVRGFGAVLSFIDMPGGFSLELPASLHVAFDFGGGGYPSTLFGVIAHLRQTVFDARRYAADRADYERRAKRGRRSPLADAGLERLGRADAPVVFEANSHEEVHRALRLSEELEFDLRIGGGSEAWRLASRLGAKGVPVLLDLAVKDEPKKKDAGKKSEKAGDVAPGYADDCCFVDMMAMTSGADDSVLDAAQDAPARADAVQADVADKDKAEPATGDDEKKPGEPTEVVAEAEEKKPSYPWEAAEKARDEIRESAIFAEDHAEWLESVKGPSVLAASGVRFAFRTGTATDKKKALVAARKFVEHGLGPDAALRALTIEPARLLGVDAQLGSIEPGKLASLALFSGDVFENLGEAPPDVRYVFVDGKKFEYEAKKKPKAGRAGDRGAGEGGGEEAKPPSVAGRWEAAAKSSMGEFPFEMTLSQNGTSIEGKLLAKQFDREFPLEGTLTGNSLVATVTMSFGGNSAEIKIEATVEGDAMSGTSSSSFSDEESEFTAKKTSGPEGRS